MKYPIALQVYSLRNEMQEDFAGTLRKVKEMGYDGVEFAGLYGHSAAEVRSICTELGLTPISAHVPYQDMVANPDILKDYQEIGCEYVVIPYLPEDYRPGKPGFLEVIENAPMLGEKAKSLGMKLCYHNHDFEFVKLDGRYALDVLYETVPADVLLTQLDVCWVSVGGEDPAAYIRKYAGRSEIIHLKDYVGQKTQNMYGLIGQKNSEEKADTSKFEFRPVGYGKVDFDSVFAALAESRVKWLIVEQDLPSMEKTPLECVKLSVEALKNRS